MTELIKNKFAIATNAPRAAMAHRYRSSIAIIFSIITLVYTIIYSIITIIYTIITIIYTIILQQYDSDEEMPWDFRQV